MSFIKHIGKHGDRKVAIVYRMVPNEDHMCLVTYPQTLPKAFHDAIMKVIESAPGQQAENLSDALHRNLLPDGRPILETLHREGMIKKVQTKDVIVTPNAQSHVRLDELNKILGDLETGNEAAEKMRKLDENAGLVDPAVKRQQEQMNHTQTQPDQGVDMNDLSDEGLAKQRIAQSAKMAQEAEQLLAESKRLQEEAWNLDPTLKPVERSKSEKEVKATRKKATRKKAIRKKETTVTESKTDPVKEK